MDRQKNCSFHPPRPCEGDSSFRVFSPKEFDQAASRQVQQMFDEMERELYEGRGAGAGILQGLQEECRQWATRFPHLRYFGQFSTNLWTFSPVASVSCLCVAGSWGLRWCVLLMRASSGMLLQARAAWRAARPEAAVCGARTEIRAAESKSQPPLTQRGCTPGRGRWWKRGCFSSGANCGDRLLLLNV